jgi:hypothetical protein
VAPRVFCIPALRAPVLAVIRRGPSDWSHVGKWDVARGLFEPGSWIRGNLYPQRCDLSPDGRWLCYFTLKATARWRAGMTYVAISRLPWLAALAAWRTCGTWTRGAHFVESRRVWALTPPDEGDVTACRRKFGMAITHPAAFAVERRRGWSETDDSPPRDPADVWDERRADAVTMEKARPRPRGPTRLRVRGAFAAFRSSPGRRHTAVQYEIVEEGQVLALRDAQWADWDADGRLLVATVDGRLQVRDGESDWQAACWTEDLGRFAPAPAPPPEEAHRW